MKILIIAPLFPPANTIGALRPYSWAKYWQMSGHEITILTLPIKNNKWETLEYDLSKYEIIRIDSDVYLIRKIKTLLQKLLRKSSKQSFPDAPTILDRWIIRGFQSVKNRHWDCVISTYQPAAGHILGALLKKSNPSLKLILDYRDLWTQNASVPQKGMINDFLEKWCNRQADLISTVSRPLADLLMSKYNLSNVVTIENGVDFEDLNKLTREKIWNDTRKRILYSGTIYSAHQDPSPLFQALQQIKKSADRSLLENLEVIFIGPQNEYLNKLIKGFNIADIVSYQGLQTRQTALKMQRDADVLLFLEFSGFSDGVLTGKLFEYLASRTLIWTVGGSEQNSAKDLIQQIGCSISFNNNVEMLKEHLLNLLKNSKCTTKNPNNLIKKYDRKILANKMINLIEDIKC
jgi:hypothetical protein